MEACLSSCRRIHPSVLREGFIGRNVQAGGRRWPSDLSRLLTTGVSDARCGDMKRPAAPPSQDNFPTGTHENLMECGGVASSTYPVLAGSKRRLILSTIMLRSAGRRAGCDLTAG